MKLSVSNDNSYINKIIKLKNTVDDLSYIVIDYECNRNISNLVCLIKKILDILKQSIEFLMKCKSDSLFLNKPNLINLDMNSNNTTNLRDIVGEIELLIKK